MVSEMFLNVLVIFVLRLFKVFGLFGKSHVIDNLSLFLLTFVKCNTSIILNWIST